MQIAWQMQVQLLKNSTGIGAVGFATSAMETPPANLDYIGIIATMTSLSRYKDIKIRQLEQWKVNCMDIGLSHLQTFTLLLYNQKF